MDGFAAETLNAAERTVVECTAAGAPAVFPLTQTGKPRIRAALIRHLLLGEAVLGARETASVRWPGVRIRGAAIEGKLDLADCARPGTGLPTLVLEDCDIPQPINLTAARLARLSLAHSRFTLANLREADIDGPFDFSYARGFGLGDCWIDARGAVFGGEITGRQARLRAPPTRRVVGTADRQSALWLADATIRGSLRLISGFEAIGGVSLDGATIHGDVVLSDGLVAAGEHDAFRAQNARVDGVMILRHVVAEGVVWLRGLRTGGILEISDSTILGDRPAEHGARHPRREERVAVNVADAEIGASMWLSPRFVADGLVSFAVSRIRGHVGAVGARLSNRSADGQTRAVNGTHAEIGANLSFNDANVAGRLDIAGARIGGHLTLLRAALTNRTPDSAGKALEAMNVTVGANIEFGRHGRGAMPHDQTGQPSGARVAGAIDLTGARVDGELAFTGSVIDNPPPPPPDDDFPRFLPNNLGQAIVARQIHVQASVLLNGNFKAQGVLIFTGATIGRDLLCQHASLYNPDRSALYAKDIEIGDDLKLLNSVVTGDLRFERAAVTGSVAWEALKLGTVVHPPTGADPQHAAMATRQVAWLRHAVMALRRRPRASLHAFFAWCGNRIGHGRRQQPDAGRDAATAPRIARFELPHARIGAKLKCAGIEFASATRLDLTGMRVTTVDLSVSHGWGKSSHQDMHCPIGLDGLVYERIEFPATAPGHEPDIMLRKAARIPVGLWRWAAPHADPLADRLLDWVLRDVSNGNVRVEQGRVVVGPPAKGHRRRFNPQPYRQLARVLRAQGYEAQARYIAIAEQWATPRHWFTYLVHAAYGVFFGFGLRPRRAVVTLLTYVVIGMGLAMTAQHRKWMVETPLIATSAFTFTPGADDGVARRAFVLANGLQTTSPELACIDITASPFDGFVYAMDTVLPFIPLHQETKCELAPRYHVLRFFRAFYAVLGWVVTSLALITVSGILKRSDGEPR